jgi:translation initiation factor 6 (eIF-6)
MSTNKKLWKDLFNNPNDFDNNIEHTKISDSMTIGNIITSNNNAFYFREKIPQSVIKKTSRNIGKK